MYTAPPLPRQPARDTMGRGTSAGEGERGGAGRGEVLERQKPLALGLARTRFGRGGALRPECSDQMVGVAASQRKFILFIFRLF